MFVEYASETDICNTLSPYKIGDRVILLNNLNDMNNNGLFEKGTEMLISEIKLNYNVCVPEDIRKDSLDDYDFTGENAFKYILKSPVNSNQDKRACCCESDICDIYGERLNIQINTLMSFDDERKLRNLAIISSLSGWSGN